MDKEEFHAVIKLVSGEEIFAKVCPCEEEDKTILILDCPVTFENIIIRQIGVSAVRINPWLKISDDPTVVMNMDKVITMTECKDKKLIGIYKQYVEENEEEKNGTVFPRADGKVDLNSQLGYISSVEQKRESLEKLFKENTKE